MEQQQTDRVELVHEPVREAAVRRFEVDIARVGEQMGPAFGDVAGFLSRRGLSMTGGALAHYSVRADGMEAAAGFEVAEAVEGGDGVESFTLPEVDAVSTVHVGPYDQLVAAYAAVHAYAAAVGRTLDESRMWEEYLTGPEALPDQMRTRVVWPLVPA